MTEPAEFDRETDPFVALAGKEWPVPELAIFQLRNARSRIITLNDYLLGGGEESALKRFEQMDDAQFEDLLEVVYQGLLGAHPKLPRDEFDAMRATDAELIRAFLITRNQSGIYIVSPQNAEDRKPAGEGNISSSTSTA